MEVIRPAPLPSLLPFGLSLAGITSWRGRVRPDISGRAGLKIEGRGNQIIRGTDSGLFYDKDTAKQTNVGISNTTFGQSGLSKEGLFHDLGGTHTATIELDGVRFEGLSGDAGSVFSLAGSGPGTVMNVVAGNGGVAVINNTVLETGAAVAVQAGTFGLDARKGSIVFEGNRQGPLARYGRLVRKGLVRRQRPGLPPEQRPGEPNAVFLGPGAVLNLNADAGQRIVFGDPVASKPGETVTIAKTGAGEVVFHRVIRADNGIAVGSAVQANTTVNGGRFTLADNASFGVADAGSMVVNAGGTLSGNHLSRLLARRVTVHDGGTLEGSGGHFTIDARGVSLRDGAQVTGTGKLATTGDIVLDGITAARVDKREALEIAGRLTGPGGLAKHGDGVLHLSADNTYTGTTYLHGGVLEFSRPNQLGTLGNPIVFDGGTLRYLSGGFGFLGRKTTLREQGGTLDSNGYSTEFRGVLDGAGDLTKTGDGTIVLSASNTYTGATHVRGGTLRVDGGIASPLTTVKNDATLAGTGTVGGKVAVEPGGRIAPGASAGTLTIAGDLALSPGTVLDYELGQADTVGGALNDLIKVGGNVRLDGTLNVAASAGGQFGPGVYRLIDYGGTLDDRGLEIGTLPAGTAASTLHVQTVVPRQVNLVNRQGMSSLTFWDGGSGRGLNDGRVDGGSGTWSAAAHGNDWADSTGAVNGGWYRDGFAVFQGAPGTVAVDNAEGPVVTGGMQFAVDGYVLTGQALATAQPKTVIRVGDGSAAGVAMTATIAAPLEGAGGLEKTDAGRLVLTAANTLAGGTTIREGALQLGDGGTTGSVIGPIDNRGTLIVNRADVVTLDAASGAIGGPGALVQAGPGTLVLNGEHAYSGPTTVAAGTLMVGDSAHAQSALSGGGALTVQADGILSGHGAVKALVR
ncbi:MAG: hypothetical protein E6Q40_00440, partial [Cupriavidus sp.]